jgi:crotonobetainyl-CoA:carnitine CoA-transferase CaiB-like acyl-CoA transferase
MTDAGSDAARPLAGLTVLDMTVALAGPFATLMLAGLGARVIKIENPAALDTSRNNAPYLGVDGLKLKRDRPDDISVSAMNRLRNKLAVTLNLKHTEAPAVLADLLSKADVVVENFSRGTLERLGYGYAFAKQHNPRIIYCSITGFGSDTPGPAKAMDAIVQALSGAMLVSGRPDEPPVRFGMPVADLMTPMFGLVGILSALQMRNRTGVGQHVDVSMLGTLTALMASEAFDVLEDLGVPLRTGETVPRLAPFGVYPTTDGHIALCGPTDVFAQALFRAIERPELRDDPRFTSRDGRVQNHAELDAVIGEWTSRRSSHAALQALEDAGVPAAEVRHPKQAVRDPRVVRREETVRLEHPVHGATAELYGMGMPIKFSQATAKFDRPPPQPGQHNQQIYGELLGYTPERLAELQARGVI